MRTPSTTQAHSTLRLYARNASANAVTVFLSMPSWARRVVSVAPIIAYGKPEDTPTKNAASASRSRYGRSAPSNPPLRAVTGSGLEVIVHHQRRVVGEALRLVDGRRLHR